MARALAKYFVVALLALVATQAVVPATTLSSKAEIIWTYRTEQHAPAKTFVLRARYTAPPQITFASRPKAQPELASRFQRPPPTFSRR